MSVKNKHGQMKLESILKMQSELSTEKSTFRIKNFYVA